MDPDVHSIPNGNHALSAPVAVVAHLMMDKLKTKNLTFPPDELYLCCDFYRMELEAELLRRKTDIPVIPATLETIFTNRDFIAGN